MIGTALGACSDGPTAPGVELSIRRVGRGQQPDISGDRMVWQRFTGGPVLAKNLTSGEQRVLARGPDSGQVDFAAISGQQVAWTLRLESAPGPSPARIALGDFAGVDTTIISGPDVEDVFPDISDRYVVWHRKNVGDVFAYDTETARIIPVGTSPAIERFAAVDRGRVVFTRRRVRGDSNPEVFNDIMLFDLATGQTRKLNPNEGAPQGNVDISGDIVVWADNTDGTSDIVYRDLSTGEFVNVTRDRGHGAFPAISGSLIVWSDSRNRIPGDRGLDENLDIFAFDIEAGREFPITTAPGRQTLPAVSGNRVVWEDWSDRGAQVFLAEIER